MRTLGKASRVAPVHVRIETPTAEQYEAARAWAMTLRPPESYQQPPVVAPWRCVTCRGTWTEHPSASRGYCTRCGTARPA